jgi:hypothetical protein
VNHSTVSPPLPAVADSVEETPAQMAAGAAEYAVGLPGPGLMANEAVANAALPTLSAAYTWKKPAMGTVTLFHAVAPVPAVHELGLFAERTSARSKLPPPPFVLQSQLNRRMRVNVFCEGVTNPYNCFHPLVALVKEAAVPVAWPSPLAVPSFHCR